MSHRVQFQLELAGESATVYVHDGLECDGSTTLLDLCASLPIHVRTLRLDLRATGTMTAEATRVVRLLLKHWRETRKGEFRLSTSHLLATCTSRAPAEQ